jgi:hypothetical protein
MAPATPSGSITGDTVTATIQWAHPEVGDVFHWVVYYQYEKGAWNYKIVNRKEMMLSLPAGIKNAAGQTQKLSRVMISAVDRVGNESDKRELALQARS